MADISEEQQQEIKERFDQLDTDKNGLLSKEEVATLLRQIGNNPTDDDIQQMFNAMDTDKNGQVDFEEFKTYYVNVFKNINEADMLSEAFKLFDKDGDGFIDVNELRKVMEYFGQSMTEEDVQEMFDVTDTNQDGKVEYAELVSLMTT